MRLVTAEITTEAEWLASDTPHQLRWHVEGRVPYQRFDFHHLAVAWCGRIRHLWNPDERRYFDAYAEWVNGVGEHPARRSPPVEHWDTLEYFPVLFVDAYWCLDSVRQDDPMTASTLAAENMISVAEHALELGRLSALGFMERHGADYSKYHRPALPGFGRVTRLRHLRTELHDFITGTRKQFCDEFRDIAGNPFCPVVPRSEWFTSTVVDLARSIDAGGRYDLLPVLADALEDAGCDSGELLTHCRGEGPHVRGCWAIDTALGRV